MPAPVQITAEQLLREAKERELELVQPVPYFAVHLIYLSRIMQSNFFISGKVFVCVMAVAYYECFIALDNGNSYIVVFCLTF